MLGRRSVASAFTIGTTTIRSTFRTPTTATARRFFLQELCGEKTILDAFFIIGTTVLHKKISVQPSLDDEYK